MPDVEIKLGARAYNLRPTFGAMREIEAQTKSSCATLLQLLARHELHAAEMAVVVYHGALEAGEKGFQLEAVGNRLFEMGIASVEVREPIADYLAELLYAPDSAKKNDVGEWFRASEEITSQMFVWQPTISDGDPETSGEQHRESSGQSSSPSVKNPKD